MFSVALGTCARKKHADECAGLAMRFYTADEMKLIFRLRDEGLTYRQIGERIGRSPKSIVITVSRRRRRESSRVTEERVTDDLMRCLQDGMSIKRAAESRGWSYMRTYMRARRRGWYSRAK